jgi:hypothetical protein
MLFHKFILDDHPNNQVELIRKSIEHNLNINNSKIEKGDFVLLLNKRGIFEKEGQRFTGKIYIVQEVGLHSVRVQGRENKLNFYELLKVSHRSQEISDALRQQQLRKFKADKRLREREGIEPRSKRRKSDKLSNDRFSGGRWAKPSNRDIFGGVV